MMTIDEALQTWCPFARVVTLGNLGPSPTYNRFETADGKLMIPEAARCIGPKCQMWEDLFERVRVLRTAEQRDVAVKTGYQPTGRVVDGEPEVRLPDSHVRGECSMKRRG